MAVSYRYLLLIVLLLAFTHSGSSGTDGQGDGGSSGGLFTAIVLMDSLVGKKPEASHELPLVGPVNGECTAVIQGQVISAE